MPFVPVFCIYVHVLGLQYLPEKTFTTADFSLLYRLPPPNSETDWYGRNTTPTGKIETNNPLWR